jgi:hypothetical protein
MDVLWSLAYRAQVGLLSHNETKFCLVVQHAIFEQPLHMRPVESRMTSFGSRNLPQNSQYMFGMLCAQERLLWTPSSCALVSSVGGSVQRKKPSGDCSPALYRDFFPLPVCFQLELSALHVQEGPTVTFQPSGTVKLTPCSRLKTTRQSLLLAGPIQTWA